MIIQKENRRVVIYFLRELILLESQAKKLHQKVEDSLCVKNTIY